MLKRFETIAIIVSVLSIVSCQDGDDDEGDNDSESTTDPSGHDNDTFDGSDTADTDYGTDTETDSDTGSDADSDSSSDSDECNGNEPYCEGNSVVTCEAGAQVSTECESGTFCNWGACEISRVDLPTDAGPHNFKTEWWYYTGHVSDNNRSFGYEITIFKYNLAVLRGYMCHVAVLDATDGIHYHTDQELPLPTAWQKSPIVLGVGSCRMELDGAGRDHVTGNIPLGTEKDGKGAPWSIDITTDPQKRPALHGDGGFIPMSNAGGTSWYYSYTRLDVTGTIEDPDGTAHDVAGIGWMDHQWGDFDPMTEFKGWDWWSMQSDDGYEVMLFQFRDWDNVLTTQAGTVIYPDGNQTTFEGLDSFSIASRRTWDSPHNDGIYPLDWDITIVEGNWDLDVLVAVDDQEMHNSVQNYWEGETAISGTRGSTAVSAIGFTELTGYATDIIDVPSK